MGADRTNLPEEAYGPAIQGLINEEILRVRADRRNQFAVQDHTLVQIGIVACCVLVNFIFFLYRNDYIALFVAASIYLNMFYFVSLLIPTSPGSIGTLGTLTPGFSRSLSWLKEVGLIPGTSRVTRLFINVFFLNTRALTTGIVLIFSIDIVYSLIAFSTKALSFNTIVIVILQAAIIIAFYLLVWKIEPFSAKYARNIKYVKDKLSRERVPGRVITLLFFSGFIVSFILFMTTIILLPGMTVSMFLSQSGLSEIGYLVALLSALGLSQYFIVRGIHGISSRTLAERIFEYKESSLQQLLKNGAAKNPVNTSGSGDRIETTIVLLESKIYEISRNSLFGLFPVYVFSLDFSVMLDSSALTRITGYVQESG